MTQQPEGRELHEAVARAMGWTYEMGAWYRADRSFVGNRLDCLTEREMLAWLHERGEGAAVSTLTCKAVSSAKLVLLPDWSNYITANGRDLREALGRLVLAVHQREQKQ